MTIWNKFLCVALLLCVASAPALSADKEKKVKKKASTPITKWIAAENSLLDTLPSANQEAFFILRNKHSVIRTIGVVQRDIKNAVQACGKENKELKKPMYARLKSWEKAVLPIVKEARKFLKMELKEQEAFHISDYKHVTKLNDKAFEFSESKIQKTPVTTKKACEGLLDSMDKTEDTLVRLLQDILLPEEVVRKRAEQAKKNNSKKENKKKK